jgi:hypothetical protein
MRLLRPLDERDQAPRHLHDIERARVNIPAYGVEYGINLTDRVFEALPLLVDDLVSPNTLYVRYVVGRADICRLLVSRSGSRE